MKKFKSLFIYTLILSFVGMTVMSGCKKKDDDDDDNNNTSKKYALVIDNGAQTINPDQSVTYSAKLVDVDGNITTPSGVTWTTSNSEICTISSSGGVSVVATGEVTVTASVTVDGFTYTASVPLGIYSPTLFTVVPGAIIFEAGYSLQLEVVHFTTETGITYSYTSSNASVASVNSSGLVTFNATGSCTISVTASNLPDNPFVVPVLVVGEPDVVLPVTRVEVNPPSGDIFKNETLQLTAKAYNPDGEVAGSTFTWTSSNPEIATVDATGKVSPVRTGETYIKATCQGVFAQAEILVNPDTIVLVTPFWKDMQPGQTFQFTATAYKNERSIPLSGATVYPVTFQWMMLDYGPGFEMFNIGTCDQNGNVTLKNDAMTGMVSMVMAWDVNNEYVGGGAMIMVDFGLPFKKK
ncbi:MAG: Ig-like domain-containing protein [Bacteroidales bacterium]|nr:Ig-like domain-containing protein [Bacteroidales bacterium]